jgi:hypothetical protein
MSALFCRSGAPQLLPIHTPHIGREILVDDEALDGATERFVIVKGSVDAMPETVTQVPTDFPRIRSTLPPLRLLLRVL